MRRRDSRIMNVVLILLVLSAGCLDQGNTGIAEINSIRASISFDTKCTVNGTKVTVIGVDDVYLEWNPRYLMPKNLTAYLVINNDKMAKCNVYEVLSLLGNSNEYRIACFAIYPGEVKTLRILVVADEIIVANQTIWKRGEENK